MQTYLHKILNNCAEVSYHSLQKNEVQFSLLQRVEMKVHITFCKCCRNFIKQSLILDQKMELYKKNLQQSSDIKASKHLKDKLEKIISDNL